ncbi:DUF885 family protein [Actinophytocola oryzae]|uniref:Uncharacterized protein (DUF885 family) n=1 Tax=Actinophytocola oryzae TaxID=502181 RepID=A0A4R7V3F7_9PSEU|nr:DUF885 family protein [Actinophytocola oryzae]TDV43214.1 uncharacterized protein (DUF885 family) [Actinophytocola oryzae]
MEQRLRAVCDLSVATVREVSGNHEYDGRLQDLSPAGVAAGLSAMTSATDAEGPLDDPGEEAHLSAFERALRVSFGELELHRRDLYPHLANLELACYEREYAPREERDRARHRHLAQWPDAVDMAVGSLDRLSAPVAGALLDAVRGLAADVRPEDGETGERALAAHARLVAHVAEAAAHGDPDPALGAPALAALMGASEALEVDLGRLAEQADRERDRLTARLTDLCAPHRDPDGTVGVVRRLLADHPGACEVVAAAKACTEEAIAFCRERDLVPHLDGECLVGPAPASRRWVKAMMTWAAPNEPDSPSWYHVTPPDESWPAERTDEWLTIFSATTLPAITVHEVAPGHFAHGRTLRRVRGPVRRTLHSLTFMEGWAHYVEEMCVEEGFRAGDERFAIGVVLEALVRVTRFACAIGLHTGGMDVAEATARFVDDAHLAPASAASEARRGTFDATYGRYTWGKLAIQDLRDRARREWGAGFTPGRFHRALLDLGCPPLGLIDQALASPVATTRRSR